MKLTVTVKPNALRDEIILWKPEHGIAEVWVRAPPDKNNANIAVLKLLKKHTGKSIVFLSGLKSKKKLIEVSE